MDGCSLSRCILPPTVESRKKFPSSIGKPLRPFPPPPTLSFWKTSKGEPLFFLKTPSFSSENLQAIPPIYFSVENPFFPVFMKVNEAFLPFLLETPFPLSTLFWFSFESPRYHSPLSVETRYFSLSFLLRTHDEAIPWAFFLLKNHQTISSSCSSR